MLPYNNQPAREAALSAAHDLSYYLRAAWVAAGLTWTSDNDDEMEHIILKVVSAATNNITAGRYKP